MGAWCSPTASVWGGTRSDPGGSARASRIGHPGGQLLVAEQEEIGQQRHRKPEPSEAAAAGGEPHFRHTDSIGAGAAFVVGRATDLTILPEADAEPGGALPKEESVVHQRSFPAGFSATWRPRTMPDP